MVIFESILTTFIAIIIFKGLWKVAKNWLKLNIKTPEAVYSLQIPSLHAWCTDQKKLLDRSNLEFITSLYLCYDTKKQPIKVPRFPLMIQVDTVCFRDLAKLNLPMVVRF